MAASFSALRPTSFSRGTMRSPSAGNPPSSRIGTSALAMCWVEQMRPVAPLRMMPMVIVVMTYPRPQSRA
jgi:hypothetical protein